MPLVIFEQILNELHPYAKQGAEEELIGPELKQAHGDPSDMLVPSHEKKSREPLKQFGGVVGSLLKEAQRVGIDFFDPTPPIVTKIGRSKDGARRFGKLADGQVIELDGLGTHKDGFRIARTKQGRLLEVRQQEPDPVQRISTRRALGIVPDGALFEERWNTPRE
jgi:hypothetical protein